VASLAETGRSRVDGAISSGPNVRVAARIENSTVEVKLDNGKLKNGDGR
jgi:hypothetical protein